MRALFPLLCIAWLAGCESPSEWQSRHAVRRVVRAQGDGHAAVDRLVAVGSYALVDIEQAMHAAPVAARVRLLTAIRRIGDRDALPLVRFLARNDEHDEVRGEARRTLATLVRH